MTNTITLCKKEINKKSKQIRTFLFDNSFYTCCEPAKFCLAFWKPAAIKCLNSVFKSWGDLVSTPKSEG